MSQVSQLIREAALYKNPRQPWFLSRWVRSGAMYIAIANRLLDDGWFGATNDVRRMFLLMVALDLEDIEAAANAMTPMTLAEQVADARRVLSDWTEERRKNVRLEGQGIGIKPDAAYHGDIDGDFDY